MEGHDPSPELMPRADHIAYLANLLTVLAILYAAFYLWRQRRERSRGRVEMGPGWQG